MGENPAKGFKVPKIRKEYKDGLREVDVTSRDAQEISHILQRSYIESSYKSLWELKAVHYVQNRDLEERYRQKRTEMKDEGRNARDLTEQYSFMLLRDDSMIPSVAKDGLKCRYLPFNALGNSRLGLYLSRNADIQLRLSEHWETNTCKMIVFKITPGKCKVLIGSQGGGESMEPTPNYDCHVAQYQPRSCDPIHLQLARSQIYLYEYTEDCEPSDKPRHCLPYAVLTYQKSQNKTQSFQSDSYSKRPALERSRPDPQQASDTELTSKVDSVNLCDPRPRRKDERPPTTEAFLNPQDPRVAYIKQQGGDVGLCVPRLTPGPPPPITTGLGAPQGPGRQEIQGSLINNSGYLPSFGPQIDSSMDPTQNQPPLYPANQNPQYKPSEIISNQKPAYSSKDPRLRRADPRLDSRLRDPRLQKVDSDTRPSVNNTARPAYKSRPLSGDEFNKSRKKMSFSDYKQKVGIQPVPRSDTNEEDDGGEDPDEMYDPSNPSIVPDLPKTAQTTEMDTADLDDRLEGHDDALDNPDDMMKALNELSDPDDGSQSPKTIANEVEEEDPILAAAMRMLVEHSGDVSLFTEALMRLQESAEEIGDALHDPAFLVKAIAENVESLTKSKMNEKQTEKPTENVEIPNTSGHIQARNEVTPPPQPSGPSNSTQIGESPMARAMKLTLEELNKTKEEVTATSTDRALPKKDSATKGLDPMDLASIPIPDYSPQKPKPIKDTPTVKPVKDHLEDIPLPEATPVITVTESSNVVNQIHPPLISSSLQGPIDKSNTAQVMDSDSVESTLEDKDERTHSSTVFVHKGKQDMENLVVKSVEHLDSDYRVKDEDRYLGFPISISSSASKGPFELSETGMNLPNTSMSASLEDKDERITSSTTDLMDTDERQNPPESSASVNLLLDKDERQLLKVTDDGIQNTDETIIPEDVKLPVLDTDERILKPDSQVNVDPSLMDRDERQFGTQSPTNISQVFMDVQDNSVMDRDERSSSRSQSPPTVGKERVDMNDPGIMDHDSRLLRSQSPSRMSQVFMDIQDPGVMDHDIRVSHSQPALGVNEGVQGMREESLMDKDDRRSHSRSQSPSKLRSHSRSQSPSKLRSHSRSQSPSKLRSHSRSQSPSKLRSHSRSQSPSKLSQVFKNIEAEWSQLMDRDDRRSRSQSPSTISQVFMDIKDTQPLDQDIRSHSRSQSPPNVKVIMDKPDLSLTDKDDRFTSRGHSPSTINQVFKDIKYESESNARTSHSRSQSPSNSSQQLIGTDQQLKIKAEIEEPLELLNEKARIRSRSSSPLSIVEETSTAEVRIIPLHNLDGSESSSDSQGLFDAYSMGNETKKKKSVKTDKSDVKFEVENEFGDVDWRLAAEAAEMGDVDLRSSKSGSSQPDPRATHSGSSQDLRVSEKGLSQGNLRDFQSDLIEGDMRTFGDLKGSQSELAQGDSNTSDWGLSQNDPRISQSGLSQNDPRMSQSGLSQTELAQADTKTSDWGLSQNDPRISQSGLSQNDPRMSQSGLSQNDPRMSQSGLSQNDPRMSQSELSQGDVDLRASDTDIRQSAADMMSPQNPPNFMHPQYGGYHNTSNMQPMFGGPIEFPIRPSGGFGPNIPGFESYTTYKAPIPSYSTSTFGGEYRSSGFQGLTYGDQYSYSTGGRGTGTDSYQTGDRGAMEHYSAHNPYPNQTGPPPGAGGGLQNIMNKLDFSSLKNILAVVQNPAVIGGQQTGPPQIQEGQKQQQQDEARPEVDSDNEENQPAFCTGLSFLRSKQPKFDKTRAKYSGKVMSKQDGRKGEGHTGFDRHPSNSDSHGPEFETSHEEHMMGGSVGTVGQSKIPGFDHSSVETERQSGFIPGFGSLHGSGGGGIPGFGMLDEMDTQGTGKPFTFSEDIPDRDISSQWYEDSPTKESKKSDGKTKSPKKKSKRNRTESSELTESWQNAILESMEESALAVKSEESFTTDVESQSKEPEFKSPSLDVSKLEEGKRPLEDEDVEVDNKRHKPDLDSDDEDNGLVIDLDMSQTSKESTGLVMDLDSSQTSKESEKREPVDDVITIDDDNNDDGEVPTNTEDRSTPVLDEHQEDGEVQTDEEGAKKTSPVNVLQDDSVGVPNNEVKTFIEKKRKNIVIKLKGQNKKENKKTGQANTEEVVGSAIEVLGQPKKSAPTGQQIHPIRGIESLGNRRASSSTPLQGSSISTLINRSSVPTGPGKPASFPNPQVGSVNAYTHPYTGQKVVYPLNTLSQPTVNTSQYPGTNQSVLQPQPTLQQYPGTGFGRPVLPINPMSPSPLQGQILVLPGQGRPTVVPTVGQQPFGMMSIPTLGAPSSQLGVQPFPQRLLSSQQGVPISQPFERNQPVSTNKPPVAADSYRNVNTESQKNYEFSRTNANKYIKTDANINTQSTESNVRKRDMSEHSDSVGQIKKMRRNSSIQDNVVKVLTEIRSDTDDHSRTITVEATSSNRVVRVLTDHRPVSDLKGNQQQTQTQKITDSSTSSKDNDKTTSGNQGEDSELEDGEITDDDDDDDDDDCEIVPEPSRHRDDRRDRRGRRSDRRYDDRADYPRYSQYDYDRRHHRGEGLPHKAASEWENLLHQHDKSRVERVPNRSPQAIASAAAKICEEASSVLSKSAATFSKAKQKSLLSTQVKTLGDWLKIELEIDNIEPLQHIIPYSLSTDLSIIPKARRRKIRLKVKTAIEEEDSRQSRIVSNMEEQQEHQSKVPNRTNSSGPNPSKSSAPGTSNAPEVPHDQIERELKMVRDVLSALKLRGPLRRVKPVVFKDKPLVPDSFEETKFSAALSNVEMEMTSLLSRHNYFGYPHRRVPQEVLLESETNSFRSEMGDVFLIVMNPISLKAYNKLTQFKADLERLHKKKESAAEDDKKAVEEEIKEQLLQRQNTLRAFTGYLNKKRVTRLQEHTDNFKMVYEFFKSQIPPFPDASVRFIKTTQKDLAQHLLIAKQYLAMEEKKLEVP